MSAPTRPIALLALLLAAAGALLTTGGSARAQAAVQVPVGDLWFCDSSFQGGVCTTEIDAGDTVVWDFSGAAVPHTTTDCGGDCDNPTDSPLWDSGTISDGSTFQFTFDEAGTYVYRCNVHPTQMRGQIIVAAQEPEPTDEPEPTGSADDGQPDATPEVVAGPSAGTGTAGGSAVAGWLLAALSGGGIALASAGALAYRRVRG